MATYITLIKYTDQGIKAIKAAPSRRAAAKKLAESLGGKFTVYLTLGRYDVISIMEAPNDEAAARFALEMGRQGNISTETMRAFTEAESDKLFETLT